MIVASKEIRRLQDGLRAAKERVDSAIAGITEAEAQQVPAPGEWSVAQLLAHIAEIQVFWVGKAVLITKEHDPQISRSDVENDLRLAAVTGHARDPLNVLIQSVETACDEAVAIIGQIDLKALDRPGHREANPMTAGGVIDYVARHVSDHAVQITEARQLITQKS